jgi:ketosteroid isomerase-like protein
MSANIPSGFVRDWIGSWNRRDIEAVLAHYADDVTFVSPKATQIYGDGRIVGKAALRAYWTKALDRIEHIRFTLDRVVWDGTGRTLAIVYEAGFDGARTRAVESMRFGEDGLVVEGEAFYGAALPTGEA